MAEDPNGITGRPIGFSMNTSERFGGMIIFRMVLCLVGANDKRESLGRQVYRVSGRQ